MKWDSKIYSSSTKECERILKGKVIMKEKEFGVKPAL